MVPFGRTAAIFDVDDSLLDGNAGTIFTWYLYSERVMRPEVRSRIPRVIYEYARSRLTEQDMVEVGSRCQQGLYADQVKAHAHVCFERHLRKRITSGAIRQIRKHLLSGHFVVIASGSSQYIIDEVGRHLRVHAAVGTRTRIVDGRITDQILPPVVFKDGKRAAVEAIAERFDLDLTRSFLYSDSSADVPLFEAVGTPVVVNPKAPFRAAAEKRGWEIVTWKERNRPGAEPDLADEWGSWEG
ncbi:HAD-superfamily subfamily IB hydrolase, TIGR01490 [Anaeromyxobacter dehalogenans 2CP-1]|uniref:HAD-superfamily subfamily IB hydrolase, TIGR01490 n=1 Tax=Anaeromyxobacter dehalogenans (strain ATCC BAA-258 / DSM 21875 / 2CP-1) TaxID=455488 RepID=B8JDC8_ANAD2|nr:HAD-IB family hydrolase [Anaeromyxobacter dehalogenans]ACL65977.1 HAD-superfamily subfamily IB hydrolase, TIGR01490 [Anaeromyxobacter dehalogenans 2CP-1]